MPVQKYMKWRQKVLLGTSLKVIAPTGQYDPTKLINWGTPRWSFKPEFGYSQRWRKWVLDGYLGVWLFTTNSDFWSRNSYYSGTRSQTQEPIVAFEGHLSYDFKPRLWASLDGNYWFGGKTSAGGIQNPLSEQDNSRLGGTIAISITKHQSASHPPDQATIESTQYARRVTVELGKRTHCTDDEGDIHRCFKSFAADIVEENERTTVIDGYDLKDVATDFLRRMIDILGWHIQGPRELPPVSKPAELLAPTLVRS